jgi:hypothetical protein
MIRVRIKTVEHPIYKYLHKTYYYGYHADEPSGILYVYKVDIKEGKLHYSAVSYSSMNHQLFEGDEYYITLKILERDLNHFYREVE